jgi:predicted O-methyltransferase YrrM
MTPNPRALAGEMRWLLDPTDPLRRYNRELARTFCRRRPATVLRELRMVPTEGHLLKTQALFLQRLVQRYTWIKEIVEVGFNAGHSSFLFLATRPDTRVLSFDLGDHDYVDIVKELIDARFPGRHELIKGDSRVSVPQFALDHPDRQFDLIYIDGGHDYEVAKADIENCARLSGPRSLVVMDDLEPAHDYGVGPVKAWKEAMASGLVDQVVLMEGSFPLTELSLDEVAPDRTVWALGRYRAERG